MLSFDLHALDAHAIAVAGVLSGDDPVWQASDPRPADGVRVTGRLSGAGAGRYYFSGALAGEVEAECRRCLADVRAPVADDVHVVFADAADTEVDDDPDVYRLGSRARELDLRPAIREQWLLSVPAFVECRADCQGLCPTCGADRNTTACHCAEAADPRWAALRNVRGESS